jgi:hypothetical protein
MRFELGNDGRRRENLGMACDGTFGDQGARRRNETIGTAGEYPPLMQIGRDHRQQPSADAAMEAVGRIVITGHHEIDAEIRLARGQCA